MSEKKDDYAFEKITKLKYILLSGKQVKKDFVHYHNSAFRLWKGNWIQTFAELKSDAVLKGDDFTRQDVISALFDGDQAVGLLLHSHFNLSLEAARNHTYLSTYPETVIADIRSQRGAEVLSMEYLTLHSDWRKSMIGLPLAEVILGLGARVLEVSNYSSMLVVTRNEKKVNDILYGFGAKCLVPNLTKHNVAVDLVALDRGQTHPCKNPEVNHWIDFFWERRLDTTDLSSASFARESRRAA